MNTVIIIILFVYRQDSDYVKSLSMNFFKIRKYYETYESSIFSIFITRLKRNSARRRTPQLFVSYYYFANFNLLGWIFIEHAENWMKIILLFHFVLRQFLKSEADLLLFHCVVIK